MKYWLTYNENGDLSGYSTYKQFNGQTSADELPEKFKEQDREDLEIKDNKNYLDKSRENILEYLEDMACGVTPELSEQEFKDLCLQRKDARKKLNK